MPCLKHQLKQKSVPSQKDKEKSSSSNQKINFQKSTTDSDENLKPLVVKEEFKPNLFKKQPKIKPNYETKSGGMLNKNLSTKKKTKQYKNLFDSSQISSRYMQAQRHSFHQRTAAPMPSPRAAQLQRSSFSKPKKALPEPQQAALPLPLVSIKEQESSHNSKTLNKKSNEQNKSSNELSLKSKSLKKSGRSHSMTLHSKQDHQLLSGGNSKDSKASKLAIGQEDDRVSDKAEGDQELHTEFLEGCIYHNDSCNPFDLC